LKGNVGYDLINDFKKLLSWKAVQQPDKGNLVGKTQLVVFPSALVDDDKIVGNDLR